MSPESQSRESRVTESRARYAEREFHDSPSSFRHLGFSITIELASYRLLNPLTHDFRLLPLDSGLSSDDSRLLTIFYGLLTWLLLTLDSGLMTVFCS